MSTQSPKGAKFRLRKRYYYHNAGEIVYPCKRPQYNEVSALFKETGKAHTTVTTDPKGDFPAIVVAREDLEALT